MNQQLEEHIVSTPSQLAECCENISKFTRIGFDTEFVGEDSYHPDLCLIQIATDDALYVVDPLAVESLSPLWKIIVDPNSQTVVHAGREEARICRLASGQTPANFFDLQIAAGMVGLTYPLSHTSLVHQILGLRLGNEQTLTEWRNRPLTANQIRYALDDVRHLLPMADRLTARLTSLGRMAWAKEEFDTMIARAMAESPGVKTDKWRKIRGTGSLTRRQLAIVRELFRWRDQRAAELNRPARVVLRDDFLVKIAKRNPKSARDLKVMRGLAKRIIEPILEIVDRVGAMPAEEYPAATKHEPDLPQEGIVSHLLTAVLADWAHREQIATNLIASTQDVKRLVRSKVRNGIMLESGTLCQGWRKDQILPVLLDVLDGKKSIRIEDITRSNPLA